jgi:hypothetical protein
MLYRDALPVEKTGAEGVMEYVPMAVGTVVEAG